MPYTRFGSIGSMTAVSNAAFSNGNTANYMSMDNIVTFCDDVQWNGVYTSGTNFLNFTDTSFLPDTLVKIPIKVLANDILSNETLFIYPDGNVSVDNNFYNPVFCLNGLCFNANSKYYKPSIGNIDPEGFTS